MANLSRALRTAAFWALSLMMFALMAPAPASAQYSYTREVEASAHSAYVFRGVQRAETNVQASADLVLGPLYGGGRLVAPVGGETEGLPTETRLYAGFAPAQLFGLFRVDLGAALYSFTDGALGPTLDEDRTEAHAGILLNAPLSPAVYTYYDLDSKAFTLEGSVGGSAPLGGLRTLDFIAVVGQVDPDGRDAYTYGQAELDLVQSFGAGLEVFVGARAAVSSDDLFIQDVTSAGPTLGADAKTWAGAGLRVSF